VKVLGISGRDRDAAAALSVDGRVVSAAIEESFARVPGIGYAQTGGFPSQAVEACLVAAGLEARAIDEVVVVDDSCAVLWPLPTPARVIDAAEADARHAAMTHPDAGAIVVCGANPPVLAVFTREGATWGPREDVAGAAGLFEGAARLARALGLGTADPLAELDRLGLGAEAEFASEFATLLRLDDGASAMTADPGLMVEAAHRIAGDHGPALKDPRSLNAHVQHIRRALAASFTASLARLVASVSDRAAGRNGSRQVGVGGGAFGNARFNSELQDVVGHSLSFAAVPEPFGRALGALGSAAPGSEDALAIGPAFSEEAIKRTLDNCRLDYVYEPDWPRLLGRVSRMLAQGKVVGWFQGPMAFGPRPLGTRSILADPSNRYARQNVNEYLRDMPLDDPLPLVVAPSMADACLIWGLSAYGTRNVEVRPEWRTKLASALDGRHKARVHASAVHFEPRFQDLLERHNSATGTPGLIEISLAGAGEPIACTPRDAVRTMYSTAIDALVIGRFLLMKDYWLLRSQEQ
jgi:carbamoyltransferase